MKSPFAPVRSVLAAVARGSLADAPDAELLRRFAAERDETAFAELVRRYGPLVWRIARTAVGHAQAAEDVFQATFLILAKQAAAVRNAAALAGWLHRTAYRAAVRARRSEARQPLPLPHQPAGDDPLDRLTARELLAAVDEEIEALPEALRAAVALCGVEGLSQEEAAKRLGWSAGSVKGRLERARARLRRRLKARDLTVPAALVGVVAAPPELVASTLDAVRGEEASPAVAKLVAEGSRMSLLGWKPIAALTVVTVGMAGLAELIRTAGGPDPTPHATAAPVPKLPEHEKLVIWSAPLRTNLDDPNLPGASAGVWTPDGTHVLTAGSDRSETTGARVGEVRVWDAATGKVVHTFRGTANDYEHRAGHLAISPDGKTVAAGGQVTVGVFQPQKVVEVWDWGKEQPRLKLGGFSGSVTGLAFSPDGKTLVGVGSDGILQVWDAATGKQLFVNRGKVRRWVVAFHPAKPVFATADEGVGFEFWNVGTWAHGLSAKLPDVATGLTIAFSPDGLTAAIAGLGKSGQGAIAIADIEVFPPGGGGLSNARFPVDVPAADAVYQVAFSPDGKHLAAACQDRSVRVYDPKTGKQIALAKGHTDFVYSVQFSPNGKRLLTVGRDSVKVWSVAELLKERPR